MQAQQTRHAQRMRRTVAALLPRLVLYYNRWTGFECEAIGKQFQPMTQKQVEAIAIDDEVWMHRDPIHPNGKVYGFVRERITGVEDPLNGDLRLHFGSGFTTVSPGRSTHPCYAVRNLRGSLRSSRRTPRARRSPRSDHGSSRAGPGPATSRHPTGWRLLHATLCSKPGFEH